MIKKFLTILLTICLLCSCLIFAQAESKFYISFNEVCRTSNNEVTVLYYCPPETSGTVTLKLVDNSNKEVIYLSEMNIKGTGYNTFVITFPLNKLSTSNSYTLTAGQGISSTEKFTFTGEVINQITKTQIISPRTPSRIWMNSLLDNYALKIKIGENWYSNIENLRLNTGDMCIIKGFQIEYLITFRIAIDTNNDGEINATDALMALQASVNKIELEELSFSYADLDLDGEITPTEVLTILQYAVGKKSIY